MKYDFTTVIDRHGKDSLALDGLGRGDHFSPDWPKDGFDVIPMWVADMNFPTVPTIQEAIIERAKHPMFGYYRPTKEYYRAIIDWQRTRNGVEDLQVRDIGYENGVLGGVISRAQHLHHRETVFCCTVRHTWDSPDALLRMALTLYIVH